MHHQNMLLRWHILLITEEIVCWKGFVYTKIIWDFAAQIKENISN